MSNEIDRLVDEIANAARKAFLDLFSNNETYYYCVLMTTGEAHPPFISAWSWEALFKEMGKQNVNTFPKEDLRMNFFKYSFADSPYCGYGYDEYFGTVANMFDMRPPMDIYDEKEFYIRYHSMVAAMRKLDAEGLFALNQPRDNVFINVEFMDEDEFILAENAKKFNNSEIVIKDYIDWVEYISQSVKQ